MDETDFSKPNEERDEFTYVAENGLHGDSTFFDYQLALIEIFKLWKDEEYAPVEDFIADFEEEYRIGYEALKDEDPQILPYMKNQYETFWQILNGLFQRHMGIYWIDTDTITTSPAKKALHDLFKIMFCGYTDAFDQWKDRIEIALASDTDEDDWDVANDMATHEWTVDAEDNPDFKNIYEGVQKGMIMPDIPYILSVLFNTKKKVLGIIPETIDEID
jgi:hypothetical protein